MLLHYYSLRQRHKTVLFAISSWSQMTMRNTPKTYTISEEPKVNFPWVGTSCEKEEVASSTVMILIVQMAHFHTSSQCAFILP